MTQNPGPYQSPYSQQPYQYPPGYGYDPMQAALAPARRAGVMMIVMGSLMLAGGLCCGGLLLVPAGQMQTMLDEAGSTAGQSASVEELRAQMLISTLIWVGLGLPQIVFAIPVRRGGGGAIIAAIVLTSVLILLCMLSLVGTVLSGQPAPMVMMASCMGMVPLALFVLQLVWLIQGLRASTTVKAMQMQYQQQYWQHAQQQQMYGQQQAAAANPNVQAPMTNQAPNPNDQSRPGGGSDGTASQG